MKLDIQMFAEGEMTYNVPELETGQNELQDAGKEAEAAEANIQKQIEEVSQTTNVDTGALDEVKKDINTSTAELSTNINGLVGLLSQFIGIVTANEGEIKSEIEGWIQTFGTAVTGIQKAWTAEGAEQGVSTVVEAGKEMMTSGINISKHGREIAKEVVNIVVSGGKMVKGITGQSPQQLVNTGVGAIGQLFSAAASNPLGSIITQINSKIGASMTSLTDNAMKWWNIG